MPYDYWYILPSSTLWHNVIYASLFSISFVQVSILTIFHFVLVPTSIFHFVSLFLFFWLFSTKLLNWIEKRSDKMFLAMTQRRVTPLGADTRIGFPGVHFYSLSTFFDPFSLAEDLTATAAPTEATATSTTTTNHRWNDEIIFVLWRDSTI